MLHANSPKVIRSDTLEYGTCKFLLAFHCNYIVPFLRYSASSIGVILKSGLGIGQIIRNGTIRKLGFGFLLAFHSKYDPVLYHF